MHTITCHVTLRMLQDNRHNMINPETGKCIECDGTGTTATPAYATGGEIVDAIEYPCECTLLSKDEEDYED